MASFGQLSNAFFVRNRVIILMDSAKSFFPTRAEISSLSTHKPKLYRICRDGPNDNTAYQALQPQSTSNIFHQDTEQTREIERPIGGEELFKRLDQSMQERRIENKKLRRTSREYFPRNVQTSNNNLNPNPHNRRVITDFNDGPMMDLRDLSKQPLKPTLAEELFKSHQQYKPPKTEHSGKVQPTSVKRGLTRSLHTIQHKLVAMKSIEHIDRQVQAHHDKLALLGEIDNGRSLVELCGDAYFQMTLRNRFEDELKRASYVYRIKDRLTDNKVISQLRQFKPSLLQRKRLLLKGHRKIESSTIE